MMALKRFLVYGLLVMVVVAAAVEVDGATSKSKKPAPKKPSPPPCTPETLKPLLPCIPAITGPLPPAPTSDCCAGVRKTDARCLCENVKSGKLPITLNLDAALSLPKKCKRWIPKGFKCGGKPVPSGV